MVEASVKQVKDFFEMSAHDFMEQWKKMSDVDKKQIKEGIGDGTLTY